MANAAHSSTNSKAFTPSINFALFLGLFLWL